MSKILEALLLVAIASLVTSVLGVLMAIPASWLWNWLVPELFHGPVISLLQMWGLIILASLIIPHSSSSGKKD